MQTSPASAAKLGGWHTATMSEDLEVTTQAVLAGEQVAYVPKAVTYDEQPLTPFHSRRSHLFSMIITIPAATVAVNAAQAMLPQTPLAGEQVAYVPKAVTYDEQPLTWEQSFAQRRRWSSGTLQVPAATVAVNAAQAMLPQTPATARARA